MPFAFLCCCCCCCVTSFCFLGNHNTGHSGHSSYVFFFSQISRYSRSAFSCPYPAQSRSFSSPSLLRTRSKCKKRLQDFQNYAFRIVNSTWFNAAFAVIIITNSLRLAKEGDMYIYIYIHAHTHRLYNGYIYTYVYPHIYIYTYVYIYIHTLTCTNGKPHHGPMSSLITLFCQCFEHIFMHCS